MRKTFLVDRTRNFNATGFFMKVSEAATQGMGLFGNDVPNKFEIGWTDLPIPAQQVIDDLYKLLPTENIDELIAKMAYLQVDAHARDFVEKTLKIQRTSRKRIQLHTYCADFPEANRRKKRVRRNHYLPVHLDGAETERRSSRWTTPPESRKGRNKVMRNHASSR